jgi:hypothetical protein
MIKAEPDVLRLFCIRKTWEVSKEGSLSVKADVLKVTLT